VDHRSFDDSRTDLGRRLRSLRTSAGLTGPALAARTGISQPKISKLETGRVAPSADDVRALAEALQASPDVTASLVDQAHNLAAQLRAWRALRRQHLVTRQDRVRELEATATTVVVFQNAIVPGLLQVAEYARQAFLRAGLDDEEALASAVAARLNRQTALFTGAKQFVFVLTEAALRHRICSAAVMRAQYDRLISIAGLENVRMGVVPFGVELPVLPLNNFVLFDREAVQVETLSGELTLRGVRDVQAYADEAHKLEQVVLSTEDTVSFLRVLAR
jgi:transcriptional regulator with XRE-family HTH domain